MRIDRQHWRWYGVGFGIATGFFDTWLMRSLGVGFQVNGHDASLLVGLYFGISFAALGYLLGQTAAARQREREAAELIATQTKTLDGVRARLAQSEKLAVLGQLSATIAHEVRNPLAVIRSAAQSIDETGALDIDTRNACRFILQETDRLTTVISTLLGYVRPPSLHRRETAPAELFESALLLARPQFEAKRVEVIQQVPVEIPDLDVDPDLLAQVLLGLLVNAAEAVTDGGRVFLTAYRDKDQIELQVADNGPGLPAGLEGKVFEPFFTTRPLGTGLGLAVARQIVEAHGGEIYAGGGDGGGACFRLRLPASDGRRSAGRQAAGRQGAGRIAA